tara:strand:- start:4013 stop:4315 length:303 start_codon:yes stop_codon:yes gene_type:complete
MEDYGNSKMGLKFDEFAHFSEEEKQKLLRLMSRIMERSYRRGVQQTLHMKDRNIIEEWILDNPYSYRYEKSLEISIGLDGYTTASLERLMIEENLHNIGF